MNKTLRNLALVALVAAPFSAFAEIKGSGTETDPYQIATAEDLCGAYLKTNLTGVTYFVQTADINMAGVKDYHAINGYDGVTYTAVFHYDGQNHVISNFAPEVEPWATASPNHHAYAASIFGVASGSIKNLGVIDAKCVSNHGTGIIAAYGGHGSGSALTLENVYVTGEVNGTGKYAGGILGTTGNDVTMTNCFANVKLTSTDAETNYNGGLIGRLGNNVELTNVYVAGEVPTGKNAGLATAQAGDIVVDGVVIFNNGPEVVFSGAKSVVGDATMANTAATEADGLAEVKGWDAYSAKETIDGYPALEYALAGEGTEANPYIIDGQRALCNAYRYVDTTIPGTEVWFVQTADVDLEGVSEYHAISGSAGGTAKAEYFAVIHYDGQNHVIKNFAPDNHPAIDENLSNTYYCTTIFGVPSGEIKNLGVIGANIEASQGSGILGAYAGHSAAKALTVENVFVEGTINCTGYTGGMFGTTGNSVIINNCFANVDVEGPEKITGGIIGRMRNDVEMYNVYVAGTVCEGASLVAGTDKTPTLIADAVIAFNTGATKAVESGIKVEGVVDVADADNKADLIKEVKAWEAFSATKELAGYPILKAFEAYGETSGIFDAAVEEDADAPAVYYNLQGVQVANPENGVYIVRRGSKVTKELIRK